MTTAYGPMMIQDAPDGPGVLTPDDDGKFMMWDGSRRQMVMASIRMTGQGTILRSGGYRIQDSSDGPGVLTAGDDGKALVWDNGTARFVMTAITSTLAGATDFGGTPGAGTDGYAIVWDDNAGEFTLGTFEAAGAVATHVGLADPHTDYLLATGTRTGASSQAQTFTNGTKQAKIVVPADGTTAFSVRNAADSLSPVVVDTAGKMTVLTQSTAAAVRLNTGSANAAARNWALVTNQTAYGDFTIMQSSTLGGDPVTGSNRLYFSSIGDFGVGTTSVQVGDGTYRSHAVFSSTAANGALLVLRKPDTANFFQGLYIQDKANNAGWLLGSNSDGAAIIAYGSGASETAAVTAARTSTAFIITTAGQIGVGVAIPTALLHVAASSTARASLCIPHGTAPTSPVNGDKWTTTANEFVRINGTTRTVASGVTGSAFTQTYNTAARTVNAYTTDTEAAYTGQDNAQVGSVYAKYADLEALRVAYTNLEASHLNLLQVVTALIDDAQAFSISG